MGRKQRSRQPHQDVNNNINKQLVVVDYGCMHAWCHSSPRMDTGRHACLSLTLLMWASRVGFLDHSRFRCRSIQNAQRRFPAVWPWFVTRRQGLPSAMLPAVGSGSQTTEARICTSSIIATTADSARATSCLRLWRVRA
ncbi:hypothetical protein BGZ61DRAFT_460501 [Ilyonectria robusta]|uniref:uncharacterized protein n=1 Tax=Ilyonectria robusta TaxID=1079257 RepID=UPI001E8E81AA|nr:uncharacterized protein BGZ61DRAFT_460501 [Ilyonectria robusta]KAH8670066.1 hypothetical protein BGZ61DRAFT_460501 [Ilyonectria robusta]